MSKLNIKVLTPYSPEHQDYVNDAIDSVNWAVTKGLKYFPLACTHVVKADPEKIGQSKMLNTMIDEHADTCDWFFILDADDIMYEEALVSFNDVISARPGLDAVFGLITWSDISRGINPAQIYLRSNQPFNINGYDEFISHEPFLTVQIGHFVRAKVLRNLGFDESLRVGQDYDYYLRLWKTFCCTKVPIPFFLNRRGCSSCGTGAEWSRQVAELRARALNNKKVVEAPGKQITVI